MNFIFISPAFPTNYYNFCDRLLRNGFNVLGIGDTPYADISLDTKNSVTEYYYVSSLKNYDDVYKAVAHYIAKYGRIDWIESENEYWLNLEAKLRTDYNVPTGPHIEDMGKLRYKSHMKTIYKNAGIPVANYTIVESEEEGLAFARENGYPLVVKPDNGMGASDTHKLTCDEDLKTFMKNKQEDVPYILEVCVPGHVETFEGITDSKMNILIATSHVMVNQVMDNVNEGKDTIFYSQPIEGTDIYEIGKRTVEAFEAKGRFFHFEFMRLDEDHEQLGKKGDLVGLEVNMRAPGAYIPDMMNFCYDVDVYTIWADMLLYDKCYYDIERKYYVEYAGRRKEKAYALTTKEIYDRHGDHILQEEYVPDALAEAMGHHIFIYRTDTVEEMKKIRHDILMPASEREEFFAYEQLLISQEEMKKAQEQAENAKKALEDAKKKARELEIVI
jgi:hypothetical protein